MSFIRLYSSVRPYIICSTLSYWVHSAQFPACVCESDVSAMTTFPVAGDREAVPGGCQDRVRHSLHSQVGDPLHRHHPLHHLATHTRLLVQDVGAASGRCVHHLISTSKCGCGVRTKAYLGVRCLWMRCTNYVEMCTLFRNNLGMLCTLFRSKHSQALHVSL